MINPQPFFSGLTKNIILFTKKFKQQFCIWIGPVPIFVVSDPSDIQVSSYKTKFKSLLCFKDDLLCKETFEMSDNLKWPIGLSEIKLNDAQVVLIWVQTNYIPFERAFQIKVFSVFLLIPFFQPKTLRLRFSYLLCMPELNCSRFIVKIPYIVLILAYFELHRF